MAIEVIVALITSGLAMLGVIYSSFKKTKTDNIQTIIDASENFREELRLELKSTKKEIDGLNETVNRLSREATQTLSTFIFIRQTAQVIVDRLDRISHYFKDETHIQDEVTKAKKDLERIQQAIDDYS